jgi:hypothetical protein
MKKTRLLIEYDFNFDLLGICSTVKEYKLAWSINNALHIKLCKTPDVEYDFLNANRFLISNYLFETEHVKFRLLKNQAIESTGGLKKYLLPDLNHFDFFILIEDEGGIFDLDNVILQLKSIPVITYLLKLKPENLKSKENLIF